MFAREDDYFFGVLHSSAHETWARAQGTQVRDAHSGFRYTPTSCFETFPFPEPDDGQRGAIADAAKRLDALRLGWVFPAGADEEMLKGRTLNRLYNEAPAWLRMAHERLDKAVYAAYGWAYPLATGEVLERLMLLNVERAASQAQEGA